MAGLLRGGKAMRMGILRVPQEEETRTNPTLLHNDRVPIKGKPRLDSLPVLRLELAGPLFTHPPRAPSHRPEPMCEGARRSSWRIWCRRIEHDKRLTVRLPLVRGV
jgi:hypothetical protein